MNMLPLFPMNTNLLEQLASLTKPEQYDTTYLTHGIHPYPAKYIPQLPHLIIREHTNERNTVLDPFCGSGTTLLEAACLGRKSIGIDSNPIAALISAAKTTALTKKELEEAKQFLDQLQGLKFDFKDDYLSVHQDSRLQHWFCDAAIKELSGLKNAIMHVNSENLRTFLKCIFSSIIVSVSNQESETRYAAKDKGICEGDTVRRFRQKLAKELPNIERLSDITNVKRNRPIIHNVDIQSLTSIGMRANSVDLVVTSPPYPNSFDYYLYHKWRMYWLGFNVKAVQSLEIGSRHEHSSQKAPIDSYIKKMRQSLAEISNVLKPSKLAYFFVGDAVINGQFINMSETFMQVSEGTGLRLIDEVSYSLKEVSRSFREKASDSCHGGRKAADKQQRVLVFEKINAPNKKASFSRSKASPNPTAISANLYDAIPDKAVISLKSEDTRRHVHSLGRYPSKFIPDIPKWAISQFSPVGGVVLDPFMGSGTTAVEALSLGRDVYGADFSPYSRLLTIAKTTRVNQSLLLNNAVRFKAAIQDSARLPNVETPIFDLSTFWFNPTHLNQIASIRHFIEDEIDEACKAFFLALLSTVIRQCSYQDEGQIKVKRDPKKVLQGTPDPLSILRASLDKQVTRLLSFIAVANEKSHCEIFNCSADSIYPRFIGAETVDLIVTSPPYINAMNYPMTHRYENFLLGLVNPREKNRHEEGYFGTERVYAKDYGELWQFDKDFPLVGELNFALKDIFQAEPKRSYIAYKYFADMYRTFENLIPVLKPQGFFIIVTGRNKIRGVSVDTFQILVSMLSSLGLHLERQFDYEIIKNAFKLTRHHTADIIKLDGVAIMQKR